LTEPGSNQRSPGWRQRVPRLLLAAGLLVAAAEFLPSMPREQTLVFRLADAQSVRRLDAAWTRAGESQPRGGVTLRFPSGANREVERRVSAPNGRYVVSVSVERQTSAPSGATLGRTRKSYVRRVCLAGGETIIALEDDR
jgi:hypothetical protein